MRIAGGNLRRESEREYWPASHCREVSLLRQQRAPAVGQQALGSVNIGTVPAERDRIGNLQ